MENESLVRLEQVWTIGAYITKKGEAEVLYHQISEGPPHPGGGYGLSKGGELEMSPTQRNFGSRSEMVKIKTLL